MHSDAELIALVAAGNKRALAELYDRYAVRMLAVGRTFVGLEREAEDLVHDVFIEVWRDAGDYDPTRGHARGWLFGRLRSRAIDRLRSPGVARSVLTADPITIPTDPAEEPGQSVDQNAARVALAGLRAELRTVLELRFFHGLSSSEIAERVRKPIGTVKSRIAAGLARLREDLGAACAG
jgi:RNA polymerase sigma-70 factor (ECF subfamily)